LRARLTGVAGAGTLTALDARGEDVTFRRVDPATMLVHPGAGSVRLVATPVRGTSFDAGTRLGLDVRVEGSQVDTQQV
ncbi:hypothetical protein, partial [Salmonella sp. SAL4455]|uniref:hypothetical protein n=1 Tax=Salmonella sp. SAL4455 TaxID=3159910 RepID=UPI00397DEF8D